MEGHLITNTIDDGSSNNNGNETTNTKQKLRNTSALLDQYQDDDDLTTNLLHAIRSWNLQRPAHSVNSHLKQSDDGDQNQHHDCNSTINTINSDLDTANSAVTFTSSSSTVTSANQSQRGGFNSATGVMSGGDIGGRGANSTCGSTITNGSNATNASCNSNSSAVKKTPCRGNYSSRPSGLTARILLEKDEGGSICTSYFSGTDVEGQDDTRFQRDRVMVEQNGRGNKSASGHNGEMSSGVSHIDCNNKEKEIEIEETKTTDDECIALANKKSFSPKIIPTLESNIKQDSKNSLSLSNSSNNSDIDAMAILQETALILGLQPNDELQKVLPTVKKLVRVVMTHVPNLEQFVDEVCSIVRVEGKEEKIGNSGFIDDEVSGLESGMDTDECQDEIKKQDTMSKKRKPKSRRRQRKKKNILARKQKMDETVRILRQEWQRVETSGSSKRSVSATSSPLPSPSPSLSQSKPSLPRRALQNFNFNNNDNCNNCRLGKTRYFESSSIPNDEDSFRRAVIEQLKNTQQHHDTQEIYDDEQALRIIENLIRFEHKYRKVCGFQCKNDPFLSVVQSSPQSNNILRDLFDADPTALRQFVLHFAYLFSVQQDEIMAKMNDLYVFSHEAATMIEKIKKVMSLSPSCPIHLVTKKVVDFLEKFFKDLSKTKSLTPKNLQQRSHHVRFNVVVEEFD